jgi:hypothetical protein
MTLNSMFSRVATKTPHQEASILCRRVIAASARS